MTPDAPEFHTQTSSPLSPLPINPPQPSNIPVLRNQIDPIMNMTSTFDTPTGTTPPDAIPKPTSDPNSPADSSFSDAYKQADEAGGDNGATGQGTEVSDDYAMTFDSDGGANSDNQDVAEANFDQDQTSLLDSSASLTASHLPTSASHDSHATEFTQSAQNNDSNPSEAQSNTSPSAPESNTGRSQTETTNPQTHTYEEIASGEVDIQQLLDNITANAEKNEAASALNTPSSATTPSFPKPSGLPAHSSLPPRPQVPAQRFKDDYVKSFHAGVSQPSSSFRPSNTSIVASGAPGTSTDPRGGLPPPPAASFRSPQSGSPVSPDPYNKSHHRLTSQDLSSLESQAEIDAANVRWGPDVQKKYDVFLVKEREYVTEGLWDRFPVNSRLFIGNLPSEKVTKRDIFHIFHPYGDLAQVAIKQAYGFVQFLTAEACFQALDEQQGVTIRDKKIHLEISKPQKNSRHAQTNAPPLQSRRSPDYGRGNGARQGPGRGNDRYEPRPGSGYRKDEYGRPLRDDYRPPQKGRSVSPLRDHLRNRDYHGYAGDTQDGRFRRRSRSRSPYGHREPRYRARSPSPRTTQANEDAELQIPRRAPYDVPDVQIILMGQLDRGFVTWVEDELHARGLKTEVMFLSPRLPLEAIIRRQILEGVHAVSQLDIRSQNASKIPLQVFDRQGGNDNVRFNEYQDLEPKIAAELVVRTKQTSAPPSFAQPPTPTYAPQSQYQPPAQVYPQQHQYATPQYQQLAPAPAPAVPDLASLVGQLDNATLQKLLGQISASQQSQNVPAAAANQSIDLAGLLSGLQAAQPHQAYQQPQPQQQPPTVTYSGYPNGNAQQQEPQQSAQQVQNIMAQLAKFRQ